MTGRFDLISVGIADENEIFARGTAAVFADDPAIAASTTEIGQLSDFDVGVASGGIALADGSETPLVVCVDTEGDRPALSAKPNVIAVLLRSEATPDQLTTAVRAAAAGMRIVDALATSSNGLDERSLDVLRMLASGANTREIAVKLSFSERTIKGVIQRIEQTLGARNRAQAVAEALRRQMI